MKGSGVEVTGCMRGVSSLCSQAQRRGADRGHSRVVQRDRQTVVMQEGAQGDPFWVSGPLGTGCRSQQPWSRPSGLLCVLRHTTWPLCGIVSPPLKWGPPESLVLGTD